MQIEMVIKNVLMDPVTSAPIIILHDRAGQRYLPIWVGMFEAQAIAMQMENVTPPRPMTHDLLRDVIQTLDASVQKVVVCDLRDSTFYALIHLSVRGEPVTVDARPSDAIALAIRTRAPIFAEETVLENNNKAIETNEARENPERLQKWLESLDPDDLGKYKM
jgi:uncharacterized protein